MKVLVFDTETTGLPQTKIINPDTLHLWPHIVQFSYIIYELKNNVIIKLNDNTSLSENNNGTFIHMEDLSVNTLNQIKSYMDYVLKKECEINVVEQTKDKMKNNINNKCKDE